jgi:ribosomal protein L37AE/L43A
MSERLVPYSCPYCADEDLRPHGETHGEWECRSCLRAFRLKFLGHLTRTDGTTDLTITAPQEGRNAQ